MLELTHLTKRYGAFTAVADISLEVRAGEFLGLLGPNGAGKTTTMSLIAGLRDPDAGSVKLNGKIVSAREADTRRELGLVPQHIALYPNLSAEQNLTIFGELYGLRGADLRTRINEALAAVQLSERRRDAVKNFSGGMQRRLNLVAALMHRPKLLLCDEPTVGVDPQSRNAIFDHLEKLNREGLTVIYSTHYMEEAARLCSRIGIIDHGKILALGALDELLTLLPFEEEIRFPATAETAKFAEAIKAQGDLGTSESGHRFRAREGFRVSEFFTLVESHGLAPRLFAMQRPSLEALFLHLTGRTLRE
ncbi:ABC transporter ATP-binding protein [Oleiharenicola lentus]|uniref:ABC transporter ATP-binding protein n=1 Tax=Oleiharenicola lentus TaxID=2508720 RepID=UPI003F6732F0